MTRYCIKFHSQSASAGLCQGSWTDASGRVSHPDERNRQRTTRMRHIVKLVLILAVLGGIGLVGFAYVGDLSPQRSQVSEPVSLDGN